MGLITLLEVREVRKEEGIFFFAEEGGRLTFLGEQGGILCFPALKILRK